MEYAQLSQSVNLENREVQQGAGQLINSGNSLGRRQRNSEIRAKMRITRDAARFAAK